MKDDKENKQQQKHAETEIKRVDMSEPPQRKDPLNESEANREGDLAQ